MVSRFRVDSHKTTTSHEHHSPGETPNNQPDRPDRATSRNRLENPGEGLRFNELRHLQTVDFARNPHAREFGRYGVVHVRYGKAKRGSPHKRRSVLTVFDWTPEVITDWLAHGQRCMDDGIDLFPSERGALVAEDTLLRRFRRYCNDLGLSAGLDLHSLRRSYATHLIEDGWDPMFVQHQMGHEHASTTALYTCVSSDFRIRTLRRVLDAAINNALSLGEETS
jgi:integrase/recombinase XerD